MIGQEQESGSSGERLPSASAGLLLVFGTFGLFYGLIAAVDPFL